MNKLIPIGRLFFALALLGLGVKHFVLQDFVTGRAPAWPEEIPGGTYWAYVSGVVFVGTGLAIIFKKKGRQIAVFAGILIFLWALLRHIPTLAATSFLGAEWTSAGKALTFVGGISAITATLPKIQNGHSNFLFNFLNLQRGFVVFGQICLGLFLMITGIQHFIFTEFVASLIPEWFPGAAVFWTYFGGVALIAGGIGLFIPTTTQWAALLSGIMVFSWFWIIHIPRTFTSVSDGIAVFEALAVSGIAFVIAGFLHQKQKENNEEHDRSHGRQAEIV